MHYLEAVLSILMNFCYDICGNYWIAIFIFTLVSKVVLLPLSLWCQKNSIILVKLMPLVNRVKIQYFGDKDEIAERQHALQKQEHYHPLLSLIPLIVQIFILMGLIAVIHKITDSGECIDLGKIPVKDGGLTWLYPLIAGFSAWLLGWAQNQIHPLQHEQSKWSQRCTNWISILISLFLGVYVAAGVIFYWICSNILSIPVQLVCNLIMPPKKYINYDELKKSKAELEKLEKLGEKVITKEMKQREKADYKRFFSIANKHLVFYSEASGFYKYFQNTIQYLLSHSNVIIHYVTNDPNDQIFEIVKTQPHIKPYYIGLKKMITLMMKMDADMVVMTTPDLDNFYIKRSYVRKDVEYIYMDHAIGSTFLAVREHAYDNFDTFFCVGPHYKAELREEEKVYGTKEKKLIDVGYGVLDNLIENFKKISSETKAGENEKRKILIAPSWQKDNILDTCLDSMLDSLLGQGYLIIIRAHPEYKKRYTPRFNAIVEKYKDIPQSELVIETDFSSNVTIFTADLVITDWSGIAHEFSFATLRPTLFINTPMKIINKNYQKINLVPINISLRSKIGVALEMNEMDKVSDTVADLLKRHDEFHASIEKIREATVYNIGTSGEAGGKYIIQRLIEIAEKRNRGA